MSHRILGKRRPAYQKVKCFLGASGYSNSREDSTEVGEVRGEQIEGAPSPFFMLQSKQLVSYMEKASSKKSLI